jgi:hypothetical protein
MNPTTPMAPTPTTPTTSCLDVGYADLPHGRTPILRTTTRCQPRHVANYEDNHDTTRCQLRHDANYEGRTRRRRVCLHRGFSTAVSRWKHDVFRRIASYGFLFDVSLVIERSGADLYVKLLDLAGHDASTKGPTSVPTNASTIAPTNAPTNASTPAPTRLQRLQHPRRTPTIAYGFRFCMPCHLHR